jgi:hypothetical protein
MPIYYVKNGGNDGLNGQSDANAWATLSKVNTTTFSPGDTILLKRGSVWREDLLKYESGTSGNPITYGSYGTGTLPQIRGDNVVTGWTTETPESGVTGENFTDASGSKPLAWWLFAQTSGNRTSSAGASDALVPSASPPTRGTGPNGDFSAEFVKANSQQFNLAEQNMSAGFPGRNGVTNGSMTVGGWIRIDAETGSDGGIFSKDTNFSLVVEGSVVCFRCFASSNGANAQSVDTGTYAAGSWRHYVGRITYNAAAAFGQKHEITLFVNGEKKTSGFLESRNTWTTDFVVGNATFKSNFDGGISELFMFNSALTDGQIAAIYAKGLDGSRTASGPTLYYKSFASKAGGVFSNDSPLRMVTLKGDLQPGNEWWDATNLRQYVRLPGDADPATTTMEVGTRVYPVRIQGNDWWVFQDIWVRGAYKANIFADTNNNAIVRRCTLSHASENGIHVYTHTDLSTSGFEISDCLAYNNGACGITVAGNFATSMAGIRIQRNETHHNCWQPYAKESGVFAYTGGIRPIGREINDCIVEDNWVHDEGIDGDLSHGEGIWFDTVGLDCIARRNLIERTTSWGVQIEDCDEVEVYSNVVVGTLYYPGIAIIRNCDDNKVYNNTLINCQGGFNTDNTNGSHFVGNQFFNNIVYATSGWDIVANNGTAGAAASTFNKNIFSPNRANFLKVDGTQYSTLASWETAWGGGSSNSIQTAPTFVNAASGDYHLAAGSSGIAAGAAIPAGTLDYDDLAFNTTTPTIGAFEASSPSITGTSVVRLPVLTGTGTATRTIPSRTGVSAVLLKSLMATGSAARTIPGVSGASPVTLKKLALSALGTLGETASRTGSGALLLQVPTGTGIGARTIPGITGTAPLRVLSLALSALGTFTSSTSRTAVSSVFLPLPRGTATATRTIPSISAASAVRLSIPRHAGTVVKVNPGEVEIVVHINAPAWRTADFGNGGSRVSWRSPLDPGEKKAYTIDCSTELSDQTNRIEIVTITLSGLAILAGLRIRAMSYDRTNITLWLEIDELDRFKPSWEGEGETHTLTCTIDVTDGQRFERDVSLQIKQLGQ